MKDNRSPLSNIEDYKLIIVNKKGSEINIQKLKEIGRGGSCLVYSGETDSPIDGISVEQVVVKEFYPSDMDIEREGSSLLVKKDNMDLFNKRLEHYKKGLLKHSKLYDDNCDQIMPKPKFFGRANNTVYAVYDKSIGKPLSKIDFENELLSLNQIISIMLSLCRAIRTIHYNKELYLDINPDNLFFYDTNEITQQKIYLFDFDSVVPLKEVNNGKYIFASGTEGWIPPEQKIVKDITGYRYAEFTKIGYQTDYYAIGAVMFWLLTKGKKPTEEDIVAILKNEFDWQERSDYCKRKIIEAIKQIQKIAGLTLQPDVKKRKANFGRKIRPASIEDIIDELENLERYVSKYQEKLESVSSFQNFEDKTRNTAVSEGDNSKEANNKNLDSKNKIFIPVLGGVCFIALVSGLIFLLNKDNFKEENNINPTFLITEGVTTTPSEIEPRKVIEITLDLDGGNCERNSISVTRGDTYGELPIPQKEGYKFEGWYYETEYGDKNITSSSIVSVAYDHTLVARWVKEEKENQVDEKKASPAPTPTVTSEPTPTVTSAPTPTVTSEPTPTVTSEPTPTVTSKPTPTVTSKPTPTVTSKPTSTVKPTSNPPTSSPIKVTKIGIEDRGKLKKLYAVGEKIDISGLSLKVSYSDGTSETVESGIELSESKFSTVGEHIVTVKYGGESTDVSVLVYYEGADGIGGLTFSEAKKIIKQKYGNFINIGFLDNESLMLIIDEDESNIIVLEGEYPSAGNVYNVRLARKL